MTLPTSGPLSLSTLAGEFGGAPPHGLSEYYRGGPYVPAANAGVPASGKIKLSQFYGARREVVATVTANVLNLNLATLFGADWTADIPKRLVVAPYVAVASTNPNMAALVTGTGLVSSLRLTISEGAGIQGAGGWADGGTGGDALVAQVPITVENYGHIYAGGGAGGRGGTGGQGGAGGQGYYQTTQAESPPSGSYWWQAASDYGSGVNLGNVSIHWGESLIGGAPAGSTQYTAPDGWTYYRTGTGTPSYTGADGYTLQGYRYGVRRERVNTTYTPGGAGGNGGGGGGGGQGQGYGQAWSYGAPGSAGAAGTPGGTNAGTGGQGGVGGQGGQGGGWGAAGGVGATGNPGGAGANGNAGAGAAGLGGAAGTAGGLAGRYIVGNSNVTWSVTGARAGRVA